MAFTVDGASYSYRMSIPVANPTTAGNRAIDAVPFPAWFLKSQGKILGSGYEDVRVTDASGNLLPCELNAAKNALYIDYASMPQGRTTLYAYYGASGVSAPTACTYKTAARVTASITGALGYVETGSTVDNGFESGTDGDGLSATYWTAVGSAQSVVYDDNDTVTPPVGSKCGYIYGPSTAAYGGTNEVTTAGMTADGSEIRFWLYFDSTNQLRRLYDSTATNDGRAFFLYFDASGQINFTMGAAHGDYASGQNVIGTYATGWTQFRLVFNFTNDTVQVSKRAALGAAWTGLKLSTASNYDIPMTSTSANVTQTNGITFAAYQNVNWWIDDVRYSSSGITESTDATSTVVQNLGANHEMTADDSDVVAYSWDGCDATYLNSAAADTYYGSSSTLKAGATYTTSLTNLVPTMTSNTTPSGVAYSSSGGSEAYYAFDGSDTTYANLGGVTGGIQYQFASAQTCTAYAVLGVTGDYPSGWTLSGSNDGSSWTTLDTRTGQDVGSAKRTYTFSNSTAYSYYRFTVDAVYGSYPYLKTLDIGTSGWTLSESYHALIKPLESDLPKGTVSDAKLYVYATPSVTASAELRAYPLKDYGDSTSVYWSAVRTGWTTQNKSGYQYPTWNNRMYDHQGGAARAWLTAGCTDSNEIDTATYDALALTSSDTAGYKSFDIPTATVTGWLGNDYSQGVLIADYAAGGSGANRYVEFDPPTGTNPPVWMVTYSALDADQLKGRKLTTDTYTYALYPRQSKFASSEMQHGFMVITWVNQDLRYCVALVSLDGRIRKVAETYPSNGLFPNSPAWGIHYDTSTGRYWTGGVEAGSTQYLAVAYSEPYDPATWTWAVHPSFGTQKSAVIPVNGTCHIFANGYSGSDGPRVSYFTYTPSGGFSAETLLMDCAVASQTERTLGSAILDTDVMNGSGTITLSDTASVYQRFGLTKIGDEFFWHTGRAGNTLTGVTRAVLGSSAASHSIGATVDNTCGYPTLSSVCYDEERECFHVAWNHNRDGGGSSTWEYMGVAYLRHYSSDSATVWKDYDDNAVSIPMTVGTMPLVSDSSAPANIDSLLSTGAGDLMVFYSHDNNGSFKTSGTSSYEQTRIAQQSYGSSGINDYAHDMTGERQSGAWLSGENVAVVSATTGGTQYIAYSDDGGESFGSEQSLVAVGAFPQGVSGNSGISAAGAVFDTGLAYFNHYTAHGAIYLTAVQFPVIAPSDLTATVNGANIDLSWTDNSTSEDGFYVEDKTDGGEWTAVATIATPDTEAYTDTAPGTYTTKQYRVAAYRGAETSSWAESNVLTIIAPAGIDAAVTLDAADLVQHHVLAAEGLTSAVALDAADLVQHAVLAADGITCAVALDAVVLTQYATLTVDDLTASVSIDGVTLGMTSYPLTVAPLDVSVTIGDSRWVADGWMDPFYADMHLTQHTPITTQDITAAVTVDAPTLVQHHALAVDGITAGVTVDGVVIIANKVLAPADLISAVTIDTVALTQHHTLVAADVAAASSIDAVTLTYHPTTVLVVDGLTAAVSMDAAPLTQHHTLTAASISVQPLIDGVVLVYAGDIPLGVADVSAGASIDVVTLTQHHALGVQEIAVAVVIDGVAFTLPTPPYKIRVTGSGNTRLKVTGADVVRLKVTGH